MDLTTMLTTMLTISTAHIGPVTAHMLDAEDTTGDMGVTVYIMGDGYEADSWLIYVDPNAEGKVPEDLQRLMEFCAGKGIDWLRLDGDGEILPELPTYEW